MSALLENQVFGVKRGHRVFDERHDLVYRALVDGAYDGFDGEALIALVTARCPKVSRRQMLSASILALSDAEIIDPDTLRAIYGVAVSDHNAPKTA